MRRRDYLSLVSGAATVCVAGCLGDVQSAVAIEEYEPGSEEDLLPDEVQPDWPDQDLERNDELNDNFGRVWATSDLRMVVMMDVSISESVEGAKSQMERSRSTAGVPNDYPLADEAHWYEDSSGIARTIFRHSNAVGQVLAARQSGLQVQPDRQRSTAYANLLYTYWTE